VDKTIEIVVVAMVALMVATIVLFLVQDRTDSFGDFLGDQQDSAQCSLLKTRYDRAAGNENPDEYTEINSEAQKQGCDWATSSGSSNGGGSSSTPGPECSTISNQRNCVTTGTCRWTGSRCVPK